VRWLGGLACRSLKQLYKQGPSCSHDAVVIEVARHLLSMEHIAAYLVQGSDKLLEAVWIFDCNDDVLTGHLLERSVRFVLVGLQHIKALAKELAPYKFAAGSIQFPLDRPLPLALIKKITAFRVKESRETDAKWRT
jgi:hypothetical protein